MATAAEVEVAIRGLIARLETASPEPGSIPNRSIVCAVNDLDAGYWVELADGRLVGLRKAKAGETADLRLSAKSDDLIALIEGRLNISAAFLMGRVRIDASPADLMRLRRIF